MCITCIMVISDCNVHNKVLLKKLLLIKTKVGILSKVWTCFLSHTVAAWVGLCFWCLFILSIVAGKCRIPEWSKNIWFFLLIWFKSGLRHSKTFFKENLLVLDHRPAALPKCSLAAEQEVMVEAPSGFSGGDIQEQNSAAAQPITLPSPCLTVVVIFLWTAVSLIQM